VVSLSYGILKNNINSNQPSAGLEMKRLPSFQICFADFERKKK
jgi:hypothetical protein